MIDFAPNAKFTSLLFLSTLLACNTGSSGFESSEDPDSMSIEQLATEEALDTENQDSALVDETVLGFSDSTDSTTGLSQPSFSEEMRKFRFGSNSNCPSIEKEDLDDGYKITRIFDHCQPGVRASGNERGVSLNGSSVFEVHLGGSDDGVENFDREISLSRNLEMSFQSGFTRQIEAERAWTVTGSVDAGIEVDAEIENIVRQTKNKMGRVIRSRTVSGERRFSLQFDEGLLESVVLNGTIVKTVKIRNRSMNVTVVSTNVKYVSSCAHPVDGSRLITIEKWNGSTTEHEVKYSGDCNTLTIDDEIKNLLEPEPV